MIKVLKAGFYSTIQDLGRFGQRNFGVPVSGAMDLYSSAFANALLGNDKQDAVIEMTMTGAELQFTNPTTIAITGANMHPELNGKSVEMFKSIKIESNDILIFGRLLEGFRTYIAVKGGFLTETVLGSRSMIKGVTKAIKIEKGDVIEIADYVHLENLKNAKLNFKPKFLSNTVLEVMIGPEFYKLSQAQQDALFEQEFHVSKYNNRMAYQLKPLFQNNLEPILTAPVLPGTVQLTTLGQLIVLMRDCQTTGGYPRILQLTENAINMLSQKNTSNSLKIRLKG